MKKLILIALVLFFLFPATGFTTEQYTATTYNIHNDLNVLQIEFESGAAGAWTTAEIPYVVNGIVLGAETDPAPYSLITATNRARTISVTALSSAAYSPADNYDIYIYNQSNLDIFNAALENRDEANTEYVTAEPPGTDVVGVPNLGEISLGISNAGRECLGVIRIYVLGTITATP